MKLGSLDLHWSEQSRLQSRSLAQVTDIGIAFARKMDAATSDDTSLPAVYRSHQILTDSVAGLHMEEVRGKVATKSTPDLLAHPNPAETYHQTLSKIMASLLFRGNAYLWPRTRDNTGRILSCMVLNPDEVSITPDHNNLYPVYTWRGQTMTPDSEIVHIPLNSWPGRFGGGR